MTDASTTLETVDVLRCAEWSRTQGIDPVGTSGSYAGYLLVEWPLPWPRDAGDIDELALVRDAVAGLGLRLQLLVPAVAGFWRVALYRRPDGPFTVFEGREVEIPLHPGSATERTAAAVLARALAEATELLLAGGGEPVLYPEILVCTHGRRDRCCGSLGTELWRDVDASGLGNVRARLARSSHTGGHRFAPTGIVLPTGTLWGFLDADALRRIVSRSGPVADLLPRYRGCSGLDSPALQALERAVLGEVGWSLFDRSRTGADLGNGRVRLLVSGPTGTTIWEATVVAGRTLSVPDCGQRLELSKKTETEQLVERLTRVE